MINNDYLTSLDMSYNPKFDFPSDGSPFLFHSTLMYYRCKFCGITAIYKLTFSKLNELTLVNLRGNRIKTIPATAFNYNRIEYLYLDDNQIQTVNEMNKLETMQHLLKLDLSGNDGFQLHNFTINTIDLQHLICERCGLKFLSQTWFESQTRLKKIHLNNNLIQQIPKMCFATNRRLYYINISENPIKLIDIVNDCIEHFICNNCNLEKVDDNSFKEMPNLKVLELNHNQITTVKPTAFTFNKLLGHLSLNGNNLTSFSYKIIQTLELQLLCLDYNPFYPSEEMNAFKNLYKAMHLRKKCPSGDNPLYHFENFIPDSAPVGSLLYTKDFPSCHETVDISFQNAVFIHPMAYENCSRFKIFKMDNNVNYAFPKYRPFLYNKFLESYSCCHCAIDNLYSETFTQLARLKSILLKHNRLHVITSLDIFNSLHGLKFVDLSHNQLELVPVELFSSHRHKLLTNIYLDNNRQLWHQHHWNLPIFEQFSTTVLRAFFCKIGNITEVTFSLMPSLEELDISNNPIETIHPRAFEKHDKLRILHLEFTYLHILPFEAIEPLVQLKRFCLHSDDSHHTLDTSENNIKLGALIETRKLHCTDDTILKRYTRLNRMMIHNHSEMIHNHSEKESPKGSSGKLELDLTLMVVILYMSLK